MTRKRTIVQFLVPPKASVVETITRYAITHVGKDGLRTLTFANQGRNHYDERADAEKAMAEYAPDLRSRVLGDRADTLQVRPVECYGPGGDATRTSFDEEYGFTEEPRYASVLWKPHIYYYVGNLPGDGGADWGYVTDVKRALLLNRAQQERFAMDTEYCGGKPRFWPQTWNKTGEK